MPNSRENAILQFLQELTGHQMHGFIVALQGETVAQGYWKPYTAQRPHRLYSVSKSVGFPGRWHTGTGKQAQSGSSDHGLLSR